MHGRTDTIGNTEQVTQISVATLEGSVMTNPHRTELHVLRAEVGGREASISTVPTAEDETELERALHELRRHMTDVATEAEEMVAEHPMASLAAAFCLGMIAGRLSGGFK
jgi:hypothetical protein